MGFGRAAVAYDRYRPGYPAELFDHVATECGLDASSVVVDVGAGTGLSSIGFAPRCSRLVCVEPSAEMAAIARARLGSFPGASVVEESFERWEPNVAEVQLLTAANTWQWLDPAVRWVKASRLLGSAGHLALIWHDLIGYSPSRFGRRLSEVGGALNPALAATPTELGLDTQDTWAKRIASSGLFGDVRTTRYAFTRSLDARTFVAVLNTYGVNQGLTAEAREHQDSVLRALIEDEFGGVIQKHEDAVLHLARRA